MDNKLMQLDELRGLGEIFVKSGFFSDSRDASQAIVKILAGRELGIGPIASMQNVYIVNGRPSFSASVIAARIKSSGKYDYRVTEHDATKCTVEFYQGTNGNKERIGVSTFTIDDARKAGTRNLDKYARNMLFARALTNGARWYCPDVFSGVIYTPDELGADVVTDENGEVVKVIEQQKQAEITKLTSAPIDEPGTPQFLVGEYVAHHVDDKAWKPESVEKFRGLVANKLSEYLGKSDENRHILIESLFGVVGGSLSNLTQAQLSGLWDWMALEKMEEGDKKFYLSTPDTDSFIRDANKIIDEFRKSHGQQELL